MALRATPRLAPACQRLKHQSLVAMYQDKPAAPIQIAITRQIFRIVRLHTASVATLVKTRIRVPTLRKHVSPIQIYQVVTNVVRL